jgi:hypothetical protein
MSSNGICNESVKECTKLIRPVEKKYPIGGYAPGNYYHKCATCNIQFQGDKMAVQCEMCAIRDKEAFDALSHSHQQELLRRNAALAHIMFAYSGSADQIIANQDAGMPLEEAIFQAGYTSGVEFQKVREMANQHIRKEDIEHEWESFWKGIICNVDGTINMQELKNNLYDLSYVLEQVPKVYCHITGNKMSKVMYASETVISVADDYFQQKLDEAIEDEKGEKIEVAPKGAVWVEATDRLPGLKTPVKWRQGETELKVQPVWYMVLDTNSEYLSKCEWLDESGGKGR